MGNFELIQITPTLGMNMITFLVLFLILKKMFFEKVRDFMLARDQKIADSIANADRINSEAEDKLMAYNDKLKHIEQERTDILKSNKRKADENARKIIDEATEKAHRIVMKAEEEIEREKAKAMEDMKHQIALLSVYAAEQIIEKKLDVAEQQNIIDGIIEEAGKTTWTQ